MIRLGNQSVSALCLGEARVARAILGEQVVFSTHSVFTVAASIDPAGSGTVTGAGRYREGETVTLKAMPAEGYEFTGWQENGQTVSEEGEYTFTVSGDRALTAVFEVDKPSRLPEGYTELEYIEAPQNPGKQCISIPIKESITLTVELDIEILSLVTSGVAVFFGSVYSANGSVYNYFRAYQTSSVIGIGYGTKAYAMKSPPTVGRHKICLDANGLEAKYDDETIAMNKMSQSSLRGNSSIPLFCGYTGSSTQNHAAIRMYSCRIFDKGILVWDGVPCTAPSGRSGLYDLVSGTFFQSKYAVDFIPGPAV